MTDFVLALPILLFSVVAHEYAHAWTAYRQGDDTAFAAGPTDAQSAAAHRPDDERHLPDRAVLAHQPVGAPVHLRRRQAGAGGSAEATATTVAAT